MQMISGIFKSKEKGLTAFFFALKDSIAFFHFLEDLSR